MQRNVAFTPTAIRDAFHDALARSTSELTPLQRMVAEALRKPVRQPSWRRGPKRGR